MLTFEDIEKMVREDLDKFDFADHPIDKYAAYSKDKYINQATWLALGKHIDSSGIIRCEGIELMDFIHGLNHCFMWGIAAGQNVERNVN